MKPLCQTVLRFQHFKIDLFYPLYRNSVQSSRKWRDGNSHRFNISSASSFRRKISQYDIDIIRLLWCFQETKLTLSESPSNKCHQQFRSRSFTNFDSVISCVDGWSVGHDDGRPVGCPLGWLVGCRLGWPLG
jgi:hypothetical protein